jgi:DNA-binding XRE family transcriptional regulator
MLAGGIVARQPFYDPFWIIMHDPKRIKDNLVATVEQIRGARGLLGWSQSELAARAGLSLPTVKRLETGVGARVSDEARSRIQRALEAAGIIFISENGGGPGVRLRKSMKTQKSSD